MPLPGAPRRTQKHPAFFQCSMCSKQFTRAFNLRSHLRSHTNERPFICADCGAAFVRKNDRKSHELIHTGEQKFVCEGALANGEKWGCGRRFSLGKNLGRHFRSKKGIMCIKPLLDEDLSSLEAAASVLTGLAGSSSALEQHHQPPTPAQTWLYDVSDVSINFEPNLWLSNGGSQLSQSEHDLPRVFITPSPTRDEALKAADTVRRYIQHHGRFIAEENGIYGYLELMFKPGLFQASSLEHTFPSGTLASQTEPHRQIHPPTPEP